MMVFDGTLTHEVRVDSPQGPPVHDCVAIAFIDISNSGLLIFAVGGNALDYPYFSGWRVVGGIITKAIPSVLAQGPIKTEMLAKWTNKIQRAAIFV